MGNSSRKPEEYQVINTYNQKQWRRLQQKGGYQIWHNLRTNQKAQAYELTKKITNQDLDKYQLRRNHANDIVGVNNIVTNKNKNLCSNSSNQRLLVQYIPFRLSDITDLTQEESLLVLKSAYRGFNTLGTFQGPIQPYEDMICFNEAGVPKVWLNSNLTVNTPQKNRQLNPLKEAQPNRNQVYVRKIFDIIENKTIGRQLPGDLKNRFREANHQNFFQAFNSVEEYIFERNIPIPENIQINRYYNTYGNQQFQNLALQNSSVHQSSILSNNYSIPPVSSHQKDFGPIRTLSSSNVVQYNQNQFIIEGKNIFRQNPGFNNFNPSVQQSRIVTYPNNHQNRPIYQQRSHIMNTPAIQRNTNRTFNIGRPVDGLQHRTGQHSSQIHINNYSQNRIQERGVSREQIQTPIYPLLNGQHRASVSPFPINGEIRNMASVRGEHQKFSSPSKVVSHEPIRPVISNIFIQTEISKEQKQYQQAMEEIEHKSESSDEHSSQNDGNYEEEQHEQLETENHLRQLQNLQTEQHIEQQQLKQQEYQTQQIQYQNQQKQDQIEQQEQRQFQQQQYQLEQQQCELQQIYQKQQRQQRQQCQIEQEYSEGQQKQQQLQQKRIEQQQQYRLKQQYQEEQQQYQKLQKYHKEEQQQYQEEQQQYQEEKQQYYQQQQQYQQYKQEGQQSKQKQYQRQKQRQYQHKQQQEQQRYYSFKKQDNRQEPEPEGDQYSQLQEQIETKNQQSYVNRIHNANIGQRQDKQNDEQINYNTQVRTSYENEQILQVPQFKNYHSEQNQPNKIKIQTKISDSNGYKPSVYTKQKAQQCQSGRIQTQQFIAPIIKTTKYQKYPENRYKNQKKEQNATERIPDNASASEIQQYIRKKYERYIGNTVEKTHHNQDYNSYNEHGGYSFRPQTAFETAVFKGDGEKKSKTETLQPKNEEQQFYDVRRIASYVESKYDQYRDMGQEIQSERVSDMLDVKSMERSLDKKYHSKNNIKSGGGLFKVENADQDQLEQFDVRKLQQNLMKFEESRVGNLSNNQNKLAISDISKAGSNQGRLIYDRKSSLKRELGLREQNSYTYILEGGKRKQDSYRQLQSARNKKNVNTNIKSHFDSIDEKFSKYVGGKGQTKIDKPSTRHQKWNKDKYQEVDQNSYSHYNSSRMATGKFGNDDYKNNIYSRNEPPKSEGITYNDLSNYLWA